MAGLQSGTHDVHLLFLTVRFSTLSLKLCSTYVSSSVEGIIKATIGDLDQVVLDALAFRKRSGVDKFMRAELASPRLFVRVRVDGDDTRRADEGRSRNDTKTNGTATENGDRGALWEDLR